MLWDNFLEQESFDKKPGAVFTHINNEYNFFPLWLKHYSKYYAPEDIYVLAHNSNKDFEDYLLEGVKNKKFNLMPLTLLSWFNSSWNSTNWFSSFLRVPRKKSDSFRIISLAVCG